MTHVENIDIACCYAIICDMVELETVLVLGAGASWDFGFPTGGELVTQICEDLGNSANPQFRLFHKACSGANQPMAAKFRHVLDKAKPPSIDAWLEHNPKFIEVGKIAIAIALLICEQKAQLRREAKGDWYQLLFQRLDSPFEDFQNNRLSIVTFNYDRSLEQYLFETFRNTHTEKGEKECKEKLNQLRILHVYGSLGPLEWQVDDPENSLPQVSYGAQYDQDTVFSAADSIEIIPEKSPDLPKKFQDARQLISNANALYFLGFGYHKTNMERLGIEILRRPSKVMGTSLGLGYQRIREVERLDIQGLKANVGLLPESVYEFLHKHVDFNESGYPPV